MFQDALGQIELPKEHLLLQLRQDQDGPTDHLAGAGVETAQRDVGLGILAHQSARGQSPASRLIGDRGHGDLSDVVGALNAAHRLAGRIHRRQQQGHKDRDNRNHNEQFHECKAVPAAEMAGACCASFLLSILTLPCPARSDLTQHQHACRRTATLSIITTPADLEMARPGFPWVPPGPSPGQHSGGGSKPAAVDGADRSRGPSL